MIARIDCKRMLLVLAVGLCLLPGRAFSQPAAEETLPKSMTKSMTKKLRADVLPALQANNLAAFHEELTNVLNRLPPEKFAALEAFGKSEKSGSLSEIYLATWQMGLKTGTAKNPFKLKPNVAIYLLNAAQDTLSEFSEELASHELMTTKQPPEPWVQSRAFFLNIDAFLTRMDEMQLLSSSVTQIAAELENAKKKDEKTVAAIEGFQQAAKDLSFAVPAAIEKETALRLVRFRKSADLISNPGDFEDRFLAAMFMYEDVEELRSFFADRAWLQPQSPELSAPLLQSSLEQTLAEVNQADSKLLAQARLFNEGLHQWRRGRYGVGDMASGLLKGSPKSNAFTARLRNKFVGPANKLYVPESSAPISNYLGNDSGKGYDRRHHYTWAIENRPLIRSVEMGSGTSTNSTTRPLSEWSSEELWCGVPYTRHTRDTETTTTTTYENRTRINSDFTAQDDSIPPRIVGSVEYGAALQNFEALVESSTAKEIEVYDRVIQQLPEFVFYSGLESGLPQPQQAGVQPPKAQPTKAQPPKAQRSAAAQPVRSLSQYKKDTLAWLMALARVEINATRAMYNPGDGAFVSPDQDMFGMDEYFHVLLDDVAVHMQSLKSDADFQEAAKKHLKTANSQTIAYLRRLKLIKSMLMAAGHSGITAIDRQSGEYLKEITAVEELLESQVARAIADTTHVQSRQESNTRRGGQTRIERH